MNLLMKQKQTHRHREQTHGCKGGRGKGEGWTGSLGLVDANCHIQNGILLRHKKDEILPFATTWMDLEGIMLSEISQTKINTV